MKKMYLERMHQLLLMSRSLGSTNFRILMALMICDNINTTVAAHVASAEDIACGIGWKRDGTTIEKNLKKLVALKLIEDEEFTKNDGTIIKRYRLLFPHNEKTTPLESVQNGMKLTLTQISDLLKVRPYRVRYAIESRNIKSCERVGSTDQYDDVAITKINDAILAISKRSKKNKRSKS